MVLLLCAVFRFVFLFNQDIGAIKLSIFFIFYFYLIFLSVLISSWCYVSQVDNMICIEKFSDFAQLGRFTLRTEGDKQL